MIFIDPTGQGLNGAPSNDDQTGGMGGGGSNISGGASGGAAAATGLRALWEWTKDKVGSAANSVASAGRSLVSWGQSLFSSGGNKEVAAQGISQKFSFEALSKMFQADGEKMIFYRGITGSEGKGALFLTDKLSYAKEYAKEGVVKMFEIPRDAFIKLRAEGLIETLKGVKVDGSQVPNLEIKVSNSAIVNEFLKVAREVKPN